LRSTADEQFQTNTTKTTAIRQTQEQNKQKTKFAQLKLFTFKRDFIKISVFLQTTLAVGVHLPKLEVELDMMKLRMFRTGT
jgi:hypothetical protein